MIERTPLTRATIAAAQEHAWAVQHSRVIIWHPTMGGYFDTDDTAEARRRFRGSIYAEVGWDGHVTRIKPCKKCAAKKPRRAK